MLINDHQNLTQLIPGQYATCYGIITDYTYPKSTKKKDFYQIVSLVDPYSNFKVIKLLIFRPDYNSFPNIKEKGEIIFCKNVKVEQHIEKIQILSNISSDFNVFPKIKTNNSNNENPIIDEYREWWKKNEFKFSNNFNFQKPQYNLKISQLKKDSKYFDIYGQLIRIFDTRNSDYTTVLISDYTENELLEEKVFHEDPSIHAKVYLQCIFWDEYALKIKNFSEGDFIFIRNLCLKFNNNTIEGVVHGNNNKFGNALSLLEKNDPNIEKIKKNKEIFLKNHMDIPSSPPSPQFKGNFNEKNNNISIGDSLLISEGIRNLINSGKMLNNNIESEMTTSTPKKNIIPNRNLFVCSPIKNIQNTNVNNKNDYYGSNNINKNELARPSKITTIDHFNMPITNIRTILNSKMIPNKYRCRVRVVDYMPRKIKNFTRPYCTICKRTFDKSNDNNLVCCERCKSTGDKIKYAFLFSLLVEDNSKCFLPIIIFEIGKSEFLGLPATDLKSPREIHKLKSRLKKLWTRKIVSDNYCVNENKKLGLTHSRTILSGNIFDVCIERYKNSQGIRKKVFDTRLL